jgi:hypothetical protein
MQGPATIHPGASGESRVGEGVTELVVLVLVVVVVEEGKGEPPQ